MRQEEWESGPLIPHLLPMKSVCSRYQRMNRSAGKDRKYIAAYKTAECLSPTLLDSP
jgi:hypothetical protein